MRTASSAAPLPLRECKIRASLLLKSLLGADASSATRAARRLCTLPDYAGLSPDELLARREQVSHKHALAVIAREQGHASWRELKHARETAPRRFEPEAFFTREGGGDLKRWFSTYAQARESLLAHGGWLFPFRQQFFVCEHTFLRALGVDATDPDWQRIGFNWVEPADDAARARLESKLIALGYTR
ncbi:hypothetical protein [Cystobacter fuscus]|uniref:hypothetical protein n=1 Tax=Cystobacter fuscus TaxID=43 RepID=UPI0037C172F9